MSLVNDALFTVKTNDTSTGTTANLLIARNAAGQAINAQPTDTNNVIGIAGFGAGKSGSVSIAYSGQFPCTFDNQTSLNDWVTLGATSQCHDAGATEPSGAENIGRVASVNSGSGLATVDLGLPDSTNTSSGGGTGIVSPCTTAGAVAYYPTVSSTVGCDPAFTTDGAGNFHAASGTFTGATSGFTAYGGGTAPGTVTNSVVIGGPASVSVPYTILWPLAEGTANNALVADTVTSHVMQMKWLEYLFHFEARLHDGFRLERWRGAARYQYRPTNRAMPDPLRGNDL